MNVTAMIVLLRIFKALAINVLRIGFCWRTNTGVACQKHDAIDFSEIAPPAIPRISHRYAYSHLQRQNLSNAESRLDIKLIAIVAE